MYHWTSEYVGPGHPDKVADRISDGVLDAYLEQDPVARVACETLVKGNRVVIAGEISSDAAVDLEHVVRDVIRGIGYDDPALGFSANECEITNWPTKQSPEVGEAVTGGAGGARRGRSGHHVRVRDGRDRDVHALDLPWQHDDGVHFFPGNPSPGGRRSGGRSAATRSRARR